MSNNHYTGTTHKNFSYFTILKQNIVLVSDNYITITILYSIYRHYRHILYTTINNEIYNLLKNYWEMQLSQYSRRNIK